MRRRVVTHALALLLGVVVGAAACGHTLRASFGGLEVELEPPVAAKLEGLTPEERELILMRGLTSPACRDTSETSDKEGSE